MAVRLSALRAGRPLTPRKVPGTHFCWRLSGPQGHSAAARMKCSALNVRDLASDSYRTTGRSYNFVYFNFYVYRQQTKGCGLTPDPRT
jgi:hypothetical protein